MLDKPRDRMTGWCVLFRYGKEDPWMFSRSARGGLDGLIHLTRRDAEVEARRVKEFHFRGNVRICKLEEVGDAKP